MAQEIRFDLIVDAVDKSTKEINKVQKSVDKLNKTSALKRLGSAFQSLGVSVIAINQGLQLLGRVYNSLAGSVSRVTSLAAEQERVEFLLADALKQKGIFTESLLKSNIAYASSLQKVTTFGDEQIIQAQKILVQLGVEASQLNDVTKATLDLAAAKGIDLSSAADLVSKSIGSTTNALSRYGIQVSNTTDKTRRASEIVENISKIFGGAAQAEANTFAGSVKQLDNIWGDFLETLGTYITKNAFIINGIKELQKFILSLDKVLKANQQTIFDLVKLLTISFLKAIKSTIKFGQQAVKVYKALNIALDSLVTTGLVVTDILASIAKESTTAINGLLKLFGKQSKTIQNAEESIKDFQDATSIALSDSVKKTAQGIASFGEYDESIQKATDSVQGLINKVAAVESKNINLGVNQTQTGTVNVETDPIKQVIALLSKSLKNLVVVINDNAKEIAGTISAGIAAGAEGARSVVSKSLQAAATAFLGPIGTALGPLLDLFTKGGDIVKQFTNAFLDALPDVILALVDGAIAFVRVLIERLPEFLNSLISAILQGITILLQSLPDLIVGFITALVESIPEIIQALVDNLGPLIAELPLLALRFVLAIIQNIPKIIAGLIKAFLSPLFILNITKAFVVALVEGAKALIKELGSALFGIFKNIGNQLADTLGLTSTIVSKTDFKTPQGDIIGSAESTRKAKGAATGLDVPKLPYFSNDGFGPVNLDAGEAVLESKTTDMLRKFLLNGGNQSEPKTIILQVGEKQLASVILDINKRGYRAS